MRGELFKNRELLYYAKAIIILIFSINMCFGSTSGSDSLIKNLGEALGKIDTNNIDAVIINDIRLDEIEVKLNEAEYNILKTSSIRQSLQTTGGKEISEINIQKHDLIKMIEIKNRLRKKINEQFSISDMLFYQKAERYYQNKEISLAKKYLEKSIEINPLNIFSLYKLALILKGEGELIKSSEYVTVLLNKTYPSYTYYHHILKLAINLKEDFLRKAAEFNIKENYSEAEDLLKEALRYCLSNTMLDCVDRVEGEIGRSKTGIYRSYLGIAESAIKNRYFEISENFIFSAISYKRKNEIYLQENREAEEMLESLIDLYLENAAKSANEGKYIKAMEYFGRASLLCDSTKRENCDKKIKEGTSKIKNGIYNEFMEKAIAYLDKGHIKLAEDYMDKAVKYRSSNSHDIRDTTLSEVLLKKMKYHQYMRLIEESRSYYISKNYDVAIKSLINAEELERKYLLERSSEIDTLLKHTSKPFILESIGKCHLKIWSGEMQAAAEMLKNIKEMQMKSHLGKDEDINRRISGLEDKYKKKLCENDQERYDLHLYKAKNCILEGDYLCADRHYQEAVEMVYAHPYCNLYVLEAYQSREKYLQPSSYQKLVEEAEYYYRRDDYRQYLAEYDAAEEYYNVFNIGNFGIKHKPLTEMIISKGNSGLLFASIAFYISKGGLDNALKLMQQMRLRNISSLSSKSMQENLAKKMSENDSKQLLEGNARSRAKAYTNNDKWFVYFKRKYLKDIRKQKIKGVLKKSFIP